MPKIAFYLEAVQSILKTFIFSGWIKLSWKGRKSKFGHLVKAIGEWGRKGGQV
jgi:hypothetical protein